MSDKTGTGDNTRAILRARAAELSREVANELPPDGLLDVVEFVVGMQRYGLEGAHVREVHLIEDITPLPGTPAFIAGIVNVRGRILPVIDIQQFLGLAPQGINDNHAIMVVSVHETEICVLADTVVGVRTLAEDAVQPVLSTLSDVHEAFLKGMTADNLVILNIRAILESPMLLVNQQADVLAV